MCYAKPGPRCAPVARQRLAKAQREEKAVLASAASPERRIEVVGRRLEAERQYYMTREGQDTLRARIAAGEDADGKLAAALARGEQERKDALAAVGVGNDTGDYAHAEIDSKEAEQPTWDFESEVVPTIDTSVLQWDGRGSILGLRRQVAAFAAHALNTENAAKSSLDAIRARFGVDEDSDLSSLSDEERETLERHQEIYEKAVYQAAPVVLIGRALKAIDIGAPLHGESRRNVQRFRSWVQTLNEDAKKKSSEDLRRDLSYEYERLAHSVNGSTPAQARKIHQDSKGHVNAADPTRYRLDHPMTLVRAKAYVIRELGFFRESNPRPGFLTAVRLPA